MTRNLNRFFVSIVLPSILAIGLYVLSIFVVIVPSFERNSMEGKKEMISELTRSACSLIEEYHAEVLAGNMLEDSARMLAIERVNLLRYGDESKDYFWVIDWTPNMVMHPYRPELNGTSLLNYKDSEGKLLFVEATEVVAVDGEGFIDYMWQWKDDSTRIVPKLSYVVGIKPWNWIVGTGIYLEDVRAEISGLKRRLLNVAVLITVIISAILLFVVRQSLRIERGRRDAEQKLRLSRKKYKMLVEASTEGTLMLLKGKIIFSNMKFSKLSGFDPFEARKLNIEDIFDLSWNDLLTAFDDPKKSLSRETVLKCFDGLSKEVIVSTSKIDFEGEDGYIIIVKELGGRRQFEKESSRLEGDLKTSLLLMNQPVGGFVKEIHTCSIGASIQEAAAKMERKKIDVLFVIQEKNLIGMLTSSDLKNRVLAKELDPDRRVIEVMSAPVPYIDKDALLFELKLKMKREGISNVVVRDRDGELQGVIGYEEIVSLWQNNMSFYVREIEEAEGVRELTALYQRMPVLLGGLLGGGDRIAGVTRMISVVADAILKRVIELAIEELGKAPCGFAFIVMGSEGRGEQTLATDQDNAIILEDDALERAAVFFMRFAVKVNADLDAIGYRYCEGDVMAKNGKWNQKLSVWKAYFSKWLRDSTPQNVLDASIFFDFRCVYGEETLATALRKHIHDVSDHVSIFSYHMAQSLLKFKPPSGILSKLTKLDTQEATFDVKKVLMPLVGYLRLLSIEEKLNENNSLDRLEMLVLKERVGERESNVWREAYLLLMRLRLKSQVAKIGHDEKPDNMLNVEVVSGSDLYLLKKVFSDLGELITKISFDYKGTE